MIYLITFFLILSLATNVIFFLYARSLVKKLWDCMFGIDEFQKYLEGYCLNLQTISELSDYYGDDTIKGAIEDTKAVLDNCKLFKKTIMGEDVEEKIKNETTEQ